jgi:selenoprotein W-related protein
LAASIEKNNHIKPELIRSGGGVFEVAVDGKLIFSKKATGRFPSEDEIVQQLASLQQKANAGPV